MGRWLAACLQAPAHPAVYLTPVACTLASVRKGWNSMNVAGVLRVSR